jgi:hypothetical protein
VVVLRVEATPAARTRPGYNPQIFTDALAERLQVVVSLQAPAAASAATDASLTLAVTVTANAALHCVYASVCVPAAATRGSQLLVGSANVAGVTLTDAQGRTLAVGRPAPRGMQTPLNLGDVAYSYHCTPAISSDGILFAFAKGKDSLLVFRADGAVLPPFPLAPLGLEGDNTSVAYDEGTDTLLVSAISKKLVALDATTRVARWTSADAVYCGICVLPGAAFMTTLAGASCQLVAIRLADGSCLMSVACGTYTVSLASDAATSRVYAGGQAGSVSIFKWDGSTLVAQGSIAGIQVGTYTALTYMPPASGKHTAHLVVGKTGTNQLQVVSLPDHAIVCTPSLPADFSVYGLAGDPAGTSLAVINGSGSAGLQVLPWPLPGMPPLA